MRYYKVEESMLKELIHNTEMLEALEAGGVDNWSGIVDAIDEYESANGPITPAARVDLTGFDLVE